MTPDRIERAIARARKRGHPEEDLKIVRRAMIEAHLRHEERTIHANRREDGMIYYYPCKVCDPLSDCRGHHSCGFEPLEERCEAE
jgi:hypothetical protein